MKLSITQNGETTEYDVPDALNNVSLGNLDILQKSTKEDGYKGTTRSSIKHYFNTEYPLWVEQNPDADEDDLFAEEAFRRAIVGIIFLARRRAGENSTVQDARDVEITSFRLYGDEPADEVEVPKDEAADAPNDPPV